MSILIPLFVLHPCYTTGNSAQVGVADSGKSGGLLLDAMTVPVNSASEVINLMIKGNEYRVVAATNILPFLYSMSLTVIVNKHMLCHYAFLP